VSRANDFVNFVPAEHAPNGYPQHGLTIREHFAALAMQGFLAKCEDAEYPRERLVSYAVNYADLLIAELAKPVTP
jgi:hypothetical protein